MAFAPVNSAADIIALVFKDSEKIRVLSKIITKDNIVIKNDTFLNIDLRNEQKIEFLIAKLKNTYEDTWKEQNQINTSIKLPLMIRLDNQKTDELIKFDKNLNKLDLVNYYSIKKFNNEHIFYEIIFNGTSINFLNIMKDNGHTFNTQKKIWVLE